MTKTADGNPSQPDVMPPPLDDQVEPAAPAAAVERSEPAEETVPRVAPIIEGPHDAARERIAALYRDARDREEAEAAAALADQQAAREAQEAADASAQHQQQTMRIVVDGKAMDLPVAEVVRRAQINSAADSRLEEAKRLLKAARAERNGEDYDEFEDAPQQPRHTTPAPGAKDRLKGIVERIQVGDSDEGVEALQELTQVVHEDVQARMVLGHNEAAMRSALDRFLERYPDLARDPDLGNTGMAVLGRVLKAELGRVPGVTQEQLNAIPNDMHAVRAMAHSVAAMRQQGHKLRDFDGVLDRVGEELGRKFNLRPGRARSEIRSDYRIGTQAEIDARLDRKRSMASQPRPAGIRSAPEPEYRRPKTASEIVAEARRARGFDR
jgi:hypothetical protein